MTRLRADRNYIVTRAQDGRLLSRATANWVYLDGQKMMPTRIAPEIVARFVDLEAPALRHHSHSRHSHTTAVASPMRGRAQRFEADSALHINNAVYVDWLEEALIEALAEFGYPTPLARAAAAAPWFYRHWIEYLRGAVPGDELTISTKLVRRGRSAGYWTQEIRHAQSDELMARGECITLWVDAANRLVQWPQSNPHK
jgi:acyl-CoA thioester hydrolase